MYFNYTSLKKRKKEQTYHIKWKLHSNMLVIPVLCAMQGLKGGYAIKTLNLLWYQGFG